METEGHFEKIGKSNKVRKATSKQCNFIIVKLRYHRHVPKFNSFSWNMLNEFQRAMDSILKGIPRRSRRQVNRLKDNVRRTKIIVSYTLSIDKMNMTVNLTKIHFPKELERLRLKTSEA